MVAIRLCVSLTIPMSMAVPGLSCDRDPEDGGSAIGVGGIVEGDVTYEFSVDHGQHHAVETEAGSGPFVREPVAKGCLVISFDAENDGMGRFVQPGGLRGPALQGPADRGDV